MSKTCNYTRVLGDIGVPPEIMSTDVVFAVLKKKHGLDFEDPGLGVFEGGHVKMDPIVHIIVCMLSDFVTSRRTIGDRVKKSDRLEAPLEMIGDIEGTLSEYTCVKIRATDEMITPGESFEKAARKLIDTVTIIPDSELETIIREAAAKYRAQKDECEALLSYMRCIIYWVVHGYSDDDVETPFSIKWETHPFQGEDDTRTRTAAESGDDVSVSLDMEKGHTAEGGGDLGGESDDGSDDESEGKAPPRRSGRHAGTKTGAAGGTRAGTKTAAPATPTAPATDGPDMQILTTEIHAMPPGNLTPREHRIFQSVIDAGMKCVCVQIDREKNCPVDSDKFPDKVDLFRVEPCVVEGYSSLFRLSTCGFSSFYAVFPRNMAMLFCSDLGLRFLEKELLDDTALRPGILGPFCLALLYLVSIHVPSKRSVGSIIEQIGRDVRVRGGSTVLPLTEVNRGRDNVETLVQRFINQHSREMLVEDLTECIDCGGELADLVDVYDQHLLELPSLKGKSAKRKQPPAGDKTPKPKRRAASPKGGNGDSAAKALVQLSAGGEDGGGGSPVKDGAANADDDVFWLPGADGSYTVQLTNERLHQIFTVAGECLGVSRDEVLDMLESSPDNPALCKIIWGFLSNASSSRGEYTPVGIDEIVKWALFRYLAEQLSARITKACTRLRLSMDGLTQ